MSTAASTSSTSATWPPAICSPTRRANPASGTSSPRATSRSIASSPTSPASRAANMPRLSGREHAPVKLPGAYTLLAVELMVRAGIPIPIAPDEVRSANCWWTYRNAKARKELGFDPRPHEETLADAVHWQMEQLGERVRRGRGPQEMALAAMAPFMRLGDRVLR